MKTEHEDGVQLGGAHFRSPPSYIRDPYNRIMGSLSPAGLLSPLTDPLVYEHTEYGTSGAPSFSSSEAMTPGRENGEQDAFLSSRDSVHSTSERIRNIALKKLYHLGYIKGMGKEAAGDMVIRCVKCDEICLGKRAALNHMFTFHPEVEPYECQLCASSFHAKNSLRFHYVVTHISERMVCDVCGKRFSHPHLFKSHRLFHELETHVCDVCDHQFCNYSSYKRHTRLHRKNLKQKRVCGFCLKKFTTDRTYWKHMERHNSSQMFHCSRCNETFMEKKVLAEHWLTHEDQLPYLLCTKGKQNGQDCRNEECSVTIAVEPKKTFRSALPQMLATSAKNLLLLGYGMTLGFPTIVIPSLQPHDGNVTDLREKDTLSLTEEQISWFSSINLICVPLGCFLSGALTQLLGRKRSMIAVNVPFVVAWVMFHYASNVGMLYASLALTGLSGGLLEAPVLTYVAEITQPHLRGMLSATASMCVILGVFIQFVMGTMLSWRNVAAINVIFPVAAVVALCFVPESPYWLIGRGRVAEAEKSLCWLRGWVDPSEIQLELSTLVSSLSTHGPSDKNNSPTISSTPSCSSWHNYTKRNFLQPYCLVAAGFFFGHFAGITTLQTYAVSIFDELGAPIDSYVTTLYLGLVELTGALFCVILVHWTGKRPLTFVSTIGNGLCFIVVATYAYFFSSDNSCAWLPVTFLIGSAFMSHVGIRLLPWILIGEVYPSEVRGVASGASGSIGYIFGFVVNKVYFYMLKSMTLPGTFWFYGVVSLIGCVVFYFFLPETEGRTLLEIQEHFEGSRNLLKEGRISSKEPDKWAVVNPTLVPDTETHL